MAKVPAYQAVFNAAAVEFLTRQSRRRQYKLLDRVHQLAADPFLMPDFQMRDANGRETSHLLIDGFIIDYWVDHAVRQVVIVDIEPVD